MRKNHFCLSIQRVTGAFLAVVLVCSPVGLSHARGQQNNGPVIDSCHYASAAEARAAWAPMGESAAVEPATIEGKPALRMPCSFKSTKIERASWDRKVKLDLSACRGIQFQVLCTETAPVSYFMIYLESGNGWYTHPFYPEEKGWNTVTISKASMNTEGKPAGWGAIKTIRISAWRGADVDTEMAVSDIRKVGELGVDTLVALLRCDSAATIRPEEVKSAESFTAAVAEALDRVGVGYATLSDVGLDAALLKRAKVVLLPHNPTIPDESLATLIAYVKAGGRVITFYGMPDRLRPVVKIDSAGYFKPKTEGEFAAIRMVPGKLPGAPAVVKQRSWNITEPKPVPGASEVVAEWLDDKGKPAGHSAIVASLSAIEMSHVLLSDDPSNKARMLLAMVGKLAPDVWKNVADAQIARVGKLASYHDYATAVKGLEQTSGADPAVMKALAEVAERIEAAKQARESAQYADACDQAEKASQVLLRAFCLAQKPLPDEFRAFWCHSAFGVEGMSWDEAIARLKANGFTAILPNMLWGGTAYYESSVLPVAPEVRSKGDQIAECVAACKKHGLQIHVWKVNWNCGHAPREFLDKMRSEGRLQVSSHGKEEPWLCPSNPKNQQLEIDSMVEVAKKYDVDGIHFDYIRYPDDDHCFCDGCKERFQKATGEKVANWPADALRGGPLRAKWLDWRRDNITTVVKGVSEQVRKLEPKLQISAAVFRDWVNDRDHVGQDWKLWCDRGYLDFVCPMDYTNSNAQFENWVTHQRGEWAGQAGCYPGIGAWVMTPDKVVEQILITRRHGTKGFTVFNYDPHAANDLLPLLGVGVTKK